MPTPNPFPLYIIQKEDKPERLAHLQGVDPKYYLTAEEQNKIIQAIQYLHENGISFDINSLPSTDELLSGDKLMISREVDEVPTLYKVDKDLLISGGSSINQYFLHVNGLLASDTATAGLWKFIAGADYNQLQRNSLSNSTGSSTLGLGLANSISDLFIAPFNVKIKKLRLIIQNSDSGIISFAIIKYKRINNVYYYQNNLYDVVICLENILNDGNAIQYQKQYIKTFDVDIALNEGESYSILMKSSQTAGTRYVPFNLTLLLENA